MSSGLPRCFLSLSESGIKNIEKLVRRAKRERKQNNMQAQCLAPEYAILARSRDPQNVYTGSPSIKAVESYMAAKYIPEPSTLLLLALGALAAAALGLGRRRSGKQF